MYLHTIIKSSRCDHKLFLLPNLVIFYSLSSFLCITCPSILDVFQTPRHTWKSCDNFTSNLISSWNFLIFVTCIYGSYSSWLSSIPVSISWALRAESSLCSVPLLVVASQERIDPKYLYQVLGSVCTVWTVSSVFVGVFPYWTQNWLCLVGIYNGFKNVFITRTVKQDIDEVGYDCSKGESVRGILQSYNCTRRLYNLRLE